MPQDLNTPIWLSVLCLCYHLGLEWVIINFHHTLMNLNGSGHRKLLAGFRHFALWDFTERNLNENAWRMKSGLGMSNLIFWLRLMMVSMPNEWREHTNRSPVAFSAEDSWFKARRWTYCVLDEGHKIKNSETNLAHRVQGIGALYRLSKTPN